MRADDERRIPVPAHARFAGCRLRLNIDLFARPAVESHKAAVLILRINDIGICWIHSGPESVTTECHKPVGVGNAVIVSGLGWTSQRLIVLCAAVYVIER